MKIEQTRDLKFFDYLANDPQIYGKMADDSTLPIGKVSLAAAMSHHRNVFLKVTHYDRVTPMGGFACIDRGLGVYEVHTMFLENYRGMFAIEAARRCEAWMFMHTNALVLSSFCREDLKEVSLFARLCGFQTDWTKPAAVVVGGQFLSVTYVSLSIREWIRRAWKNYVADGEKFHAQLFAQLGGPLHPEDKNHDGMVGLTLRMGLAGQPDKARIVYNEWAGVAGYLPAQFLGARGNVCAIDINKAIVEVDQELNVALLVKE